MRCKSREMAENVSTGWLTTRKTKKRKPLEEKNECGAGMQDNQHYLREREKKVCRYDLDSMHAHPAQDHRRIQCSGSAQDGPSQEEVLYMRDFVFLWHQMPFISCI